MTSAQEAQIYTVSKPKSELLLKAINILVFAGDDLENNFGEISDFISKKSQIQTSEVYVVLLGDVKELPVDLVQSTFGDLARLDLPVEILFYDDGKGRPPKNLPPATIYHLAELRLVSIQSFDLEGNLKSYARAADGKLEILFLFPGAMFPVNMGAHRRALNMLAALVEHGFNVTIAYTGASARIRQEAAPFLRLLAKQIEPFSNKQNPLLKVVVEAKKALRMFVNRLRGIRSISAESFIDRARLRNNKHLRKALAQLDANNFDAIFVNYAWMLPSVERKTIYRPLIICDTHDVQYFRTLSMKGDGKALTASIRRSKNREISLLRRADYVLAISERDGDLLRRDIPVEKVLVAPSSYRYCFMEVRKPRASSPMVFGFLGRDMPANVVALELVLNEWWPAISRYSPASKIVVAGSVCSAPGIRKIAFLNDSIELVGSVRTVTGFFEGIDVLLSPVLVAGGMNFKNAEAIVAGVTLITNRLGAEAIGDGDLHIANSAQDVIELLKNIELDPEAELQHRARSQDVLMRKFTPNPAVEMLAALISQRKST
ncbi:glycosyltransferase [Ferirhizobium litorale]|uniref:Glycosyltransferase n=2 Tax=Ferirhizobium litorale TaxID=2927786 RepID=A0AAE3QB97_9HYPH|nr:glycosyltransferase [Fererhizobium litorale]MDI7922627.1 glycosyltransferase [Fererhizobium litorale]